MTGATGSDTPAAVPGQSAATAEMPDTPEEWLRVAEVMYPGEKPDLRHASTMTALLVYAAKYQIRTLLASRATPPESVGALLDAYAEAASGMSHYRDAEALKVLVEARARLDAALAGIAEDGERLTRERDRLLDGMQFIWDALDNDDEAEAFRMADEMRRTPTQSLAARSSHSAAPREDTDA